MSTVERTTLKLLALVLIIKILKKRRLIGRRPDTDSSLSGAGYINELLEGNVAHSIEILRMKTNVFLHMCNHFRTKGWLQNSRYICVEEKVAIFIMTLSHNERNRLVKRRFNHSTHTIHRYFHEVLQAMLKFSKEMIVPTMYNQNIDQIRQHRRLREIFQGAVGALDGTLIHAVIPTDKQVPYRGRGRGQCYQNVLGICDFDMIFTFIWAGWEGVAHDSRVLTETMRDPSNNFPFPPPDKYYLCDAAYTHTRRFMVPYRNVRYWLADFRRSGRPRTKEEMFNHAHARLRNVIERAFGVLKARFPILKTMASYPFPVQRNIVIACVTMHNFIRKVAISDSFLDQFEDEDIAIENFQNNETATPMESETEGGRSQADRNFMINLREQIANELFNNHR